MCVWCVMQGRCQNKKKNVFFEFGISAQGGAAQQKFFNKFCVCVCVWGLALARLWRFLCHTSHCHLNALLLLLPSSLSLSLSLPPSSLAISHSYSLAWHSCA